MLGSVCQDSATLVITPTFENIRASTSYVNSPAILAKGIGRVAMGLYGTISPGAGFEAPKGYVVLSMRDSISGFSYSKFFFVSCEQKIYSSIV